MTMRNESSATETSNSTRVKAERSVRADAAPGSEESGRCTGLKLDFRDAKVGSITAQSLPVSVVAQYVTTVDFGLPFPSGRTGHGSTGHESAIVTGRSALVWAGRGCSRRRA